MAVPIDPDHAGVPYPLAVAEEPDAIPTSGKLDAVEAAVPFKAGVARLISGFDTPEERLKRPVESAHGGLGGTEVEPGEVAVGKPGGLFAIPDAFLHGLAGGFPLFEAGVVKRRWVSGTIPSSRSWFRFVQSLYLKARNIYLPFWLSM
jgi:hypothetical protein